jgi:Glycosyl hydrolases family 18
MTNRSVTMVLLAALSATLFAVAVRASDGARAEAPKSNQAFMGYWLGYVQGGAPLQATPASVGIVALAFAVTSPGPDGDTISLDFLTSQHPAEEIRAGVKALQARGVKVVMSINGKPNWAGHAGGWENLDPAAFAANVKAIVVDQWGLDGVDLDNEAGAVTPGENFVQVVKALRQALGPDALLTLPVFMGPRRDGYLSQVRDEISFVSTMGYWSGFDIQIMRFNKYAALVGPEKVAIGVADAATPTSQNTRFSIVSRLAAWNPEGAHKAGMMLWNLNPPSLEQEATAEWCAAIADNLP